MSGTSSLVGTSHCTSGGLLQLVLQTDVLLLQESDLGGDLTDRVQTLDVDVGRSTWRGQGDVMISVRSCFASVRFLTNLTGTKPPYLVTKLITGSNI